MQQDNKLVAKGRKMLDTNKIADSVLLSALRQNGHDSRFSIRAMRKTATCSIDN